MAYKSNFFKSGKYNAASHVAVTNPPRDLPSMKTTVATPAANTRTLAVVGAELEAAKKKEKSAIAAANNYVSNYMGAMDLQDPAELEALNKAAADATAAREKLEREYNSLPGSYDAKYGHIGDAGKAFATVLSKPFLAVDVVADTAKAAAKGETVDTNSLAHQKYNDLNLMREDALSETSGFGRTLAETGLSIADNLYARALTLGSPIGGGLSMGITSAADKMHELNNKGEDAGRSLIRGAISGGIEGATEALPIGTLADMVKTGGKGIVKNLLKQGGVEATEEGISYLANYIADKAFKDPNAKWDWNEFKESVLSGGLSGLFFGLGGTFIGKAKSRANANPEISPTTPTNDVTPNTTPSERKTAPNAVNGAEAGKPKITMADFTNVDSPVWNNVAYDDKETQSSIMSQTRQEMIDAGEVVVVPTSTTEQVSDSYPDLRTMKKAERTPILRQKMDELKTSLRQFLNGLKGGSYEFEVNGNVLEARLYDTGVREVMEKVTQDKASMLYHSDQVFQNARYLYSTPDYDGDPNVYRWNYFYTPVQIGNETVDVRIAVRDVAKGTNFEPESQIYNWGIKKDATLSGGSRGPKVASPGASSAASTSGGIVTPEVPVVNSGDTESVGAAPSGFDPYSNMISQYGIIPEGENPARMVDLPKSTNGEDRVSYSARNVMEAQATPDAMLGEIANALLSGELSHEVNTDTSAMERARAAVKDKGWDGAKESFHQLAKKGVVSKDAVALGQVLLNNAMNAGDAKAVIDILVDYSAMSTTAAQSLQAQRMLKKLTPEGQLYGIQRSVKNLQEELANKYKDKAPNLEIPENLVQNFLSAKDQDTRDAAINEIYKSIARQVPSTWTDKWNAWRYMAMLTNPRTHVRNIVGNFGFAPVRFVKNAIASVTETALDTVLPKGIDRTKALLNPASKSDRALITAALKDVKNVKSQLEGAGKYSDAPANKIEEYRRVFNLAPLEAVRKGNTALMNAEDTLFSAPAYAGALSGYLKANGVAAEALTSGTVDSTLLDNARSYAVKEAQKATYRDQNAFSDYISKLHYKGDNNVGKAVNTLVEGVLPFRRTPANILARGVEYSPVGLVKSLSYDLVQVKNGNKTAAEAIDGISAGLTGTGLLALGAYLASCGLISGGASGDEEKDAMASLTGVQNYALSLDGENFTLDWLAPEALPFFVGVELYNAATDKSKAGVDYKSVSSALERISDPMLEMSMLSGVQDLIETGKYAEGGLVWKLIGTSAISYLTQAIPTLVGQIERSFEADRETTFVDRNSGLPNDLQYNIGNVMNKIPFEYNQIPYVDAWGRTAETGNAAERIFNNFLNPAYTSTENVTEADKEINRLLGEGFGSVAPDRASQSQKVNKQYMDADQYVEYATTKGQTSFDIVSDMVGSQFYKSLSDTEKAEAIQLAYTYASAVASKTVDKSYKLSGTAASIQKAVDAGMDAADYITYYSNKSEYDTDKNGSYTTAENIAAIEASGMNGKERTALYMVTFPSWVDGAAKRGVDFERYLSYKIATNGATKKADKIASLVDAGYTVVEANRMYKEME